MDHTNLTEGYKAKRDALLSKNEGGCKLTTYLDTRGIPTIGVGVSLVTPIKNKKTGGTDFVPNWENLKEIAKELGQDSTEYQDIEKFAKQVADAINNTPEPKYKYDDEKKKYIRTVDAFEKSERGQKLVQAVGELNQDWAATSSPSLSDEDAAEISSAVADIHEEQLDNDLINKWGVDPNSLTEDQRAVLLDAEYHGRSKEAEQLAKAIKDGLDNNKTVEEINKKLVDILLNSPYYKAFAYRINNDCKLLKPQWIPRYPGILPDIRECNQLYKKASLTKSPIIVDLDKDGVETTSLVDGTYFDHDGNGFMEQTAWVAPYGHDGLLVMDRDGNGSIDTGNELFGDQTILKDGSKAANGFQALAELDDNKDGKIDANDAAYSQLRIWQDFNGDGYVGYDVDENGQEINGELQTLEEAGVQSININYTSVNQTDENGNVIKQIGTFTSTDGSTGTAADVWLQTDPTYTIASEVLDVTPEIAALPDLQGYGNVYNLQQAMVRDTSGHLQGLIEQFANETDSAARRALVTTILYAWTGVEGVDPLSRAARMIYGNAIGDARKLATLEAFMGEPYLGTWCGNTRDPNPHGPASKILLQAFDELADNTYSLLMSQTFYKNVFDSIVMTWNEETGQFDWDVSATPAALQALYISNSDNAPLAMSEFADILNLAGDPGLQAMEDLRAQGNVASSDDFSRLLGLLGRTAKMGDAGNNTLQGTDKADALYGMGGNDNLYGYAGDDILDGGTGNDYLAGNTGNDTYLFNQGGGQDTIFDNEASSGNADTIRFGAGILPSDITFTRSGYDLALGIKGTTDQLTLYGWGVTQAYRIEQVEFAEDTKERLGIRARGREAIGGDGTYQLREAS